MLIVSIAGELCYYFLGIDMLLDAFSDFFVASDFFPDFDVSLERGSAPTVLMYDFPEGSKWVTTPCENMVFISSGVVLVSIMAGFLTVQSAGVQTLFSYFRVNCRLSMDLKISSVLRPMDQG